MADTNKNIVISVEEFTKLTQLVQDLKKANQALNAQIHAYNVHAAQANARAE